MNTTNSRLERSSMYLRCLLREMPSEQCDLLVLHAKLAGASSSMLTAAMEQWSPEKREAALRRTSNVQPLDVIASLFQNANGDTKALAEKAMTDILKEISRRTAASKHNRKVNIEFKSGLISLLFSGLKPGSMRRKFFSLLEADPPEVQQAALVRFADDPPAPGDVDFLIALLDCRGVSQVAATNLLSWNVSFAELQPWLERNFEGNHSGRSDVMATLEILLKGFSTHSWVRRKCLNVVRESYKHPSPSIAGDVLIGSIAAEPKDAKAVRRIATVLRKFHDRGNSLAVEHLFACFAAYRSSTHVQELLIGLATNCDIDRDLRRGVIHIMAQVKEVEAVFAALCRIIESIPYLLNAEKAIENMDLQPHMVLRELRNARSSHLKAVLLGKLLVWVGDYPELYYEALLDKDPEIACVGLSGLKKLGGPKEAAYLSNNFQQSAAKEALTVLLGMILAPGH